MAVSQSVDRVVGTAFALDWAWRVSLGAPTAAADDGALP